MTDTTRGARCLGVGGRGRVKFDVQREVPGYHRNVAGDFLSLWPVIGVAGAGEAIFSNLEFKALGTV